MLHVFPAEGRIEHAGINLQRVYANTIANTLEPTQVWQRRQNNLLPGLAMARAADRCVHGETKRAVTSSLGALHEIASEAAVRLRVELKPQGTGGHSRHLFKARINQATDHHGRAGGACTA